MKAEIETDLMRIEKERWGGRLGIRVDLKIERKRKISFCQSRIF